MKFKCIDLFSGIGGFSYALQSIAETITYCEIDENCQKVLIKNSNIPIIDDVKNFDTSKFKDANMITAGFPCTNISTANKSAKGIRGKNSNLFFKILNIIDDIPNINILLLENSPFIKFRGLNIVIKELEKRNFKCVWGYFSANMVGAIHLRRRWYCLCYKNNIDWPKLGIYKHNWTKNIKRLVNKNQTNLLRNKMLGNSVVPQVVQLAYNILSSYATNNITGEIQYKPEINSKFNITLSDGYKKYIKNYWATPVYSTWHQYRKLTKRSTTILSNQIYYEENTICNENIPINQRSKFYDINPKFIENLMGYPKDWTRF
jgi:DNA (cytosine-5)-methyltransferase 1